MSELGSSVTGFLTNGPKGAFVIYDYVVSLFAVVLNAIILRSVVNAKIHLTGYKFFLVSLSVSNLYVSFVNIAILAIEAALMHDLNSKCIAKIFRSLQISSLLINLLNLCGMSLDHLIGIVYPFAYDRIMRRSTVRCAVAILWTISIILGSAELPLTTIVYLNQEQPVTGLTGGNAMADANNCSAGSDPGAGNKELLMQLATNTSAAHKYNPLLQALLFEAAANKDLLADLNNELTTKSSTTSITTPTRRTTTTKKQLVNSKTSKTKKRKVDHVRSAKASQLDAKSKEQDEMTTVSPTSSLKINMDPGAGSNYGCLFNKMLAALDHLSSHSQERHAQQQLTWCQLYRNAPYLEYTIMALTVICFIFIAYCYGKIFSEMLSHGEESSEKKNVRRFVMTTVLLVANFSVCYLIYMVFELALAIAMHLNTSGEGQQNMAGAWPHLMVAQNVLSSVLLTSPLVQPLIYAGRLSTVRKQILLDLHLSSSSSSLEMRRP